MSEFTDLIPLPNKKKHQEGGPIHQKMGRILLYVIQKYAAERVTMHAIIYAAWKRMSTYRRTISAWKTNCAQRSFGFPATLVCRFHCLAIHSLLPFNSFRHLIRRPSFLPYGDYGVPFQSSLAE